MQRQPPEPASAPGPGSAPEPVSHAKLTRESYHSSDTGSERDYFVYLPVGYETERARSWPLLVVLHGDGERGDAKSDLDYLLKNGPLYEAWIQKRDLPFVIVAPQLPLYGRDQSVSYLQARTRAEIPERLADGVPPRPPEFPTPSPFSGAVANADLPYGPEGPPDGWSKLEADVVQIVDAVTRSHRVDPQRRYLTGISYGAFGAWYLASRHPDLFAALAPVVGWGHPDLMPPLARTDLPIWVFAGGRDTTIEAQYFYPGLATLESLGHSRLRFTVEADMGHDVWARVYAGRDLYDWLLGFSQGAGRAP
ncbi:MAG TPA: alpha/beta hydrolase-fold protein [Polyangiaceae bacterium]